MVKGRKDMPGRFACDGSLSAQVEATARCARKWKRRLATRARRDVRGALGENLGAGLRGLVLGGGLYGSF
jgi:hypothetical protein